MSRAASMQVLNNAFSNFNNAMASIILQESQKSFVAQNIILLIFTISLIVLGLKIIIKNFPNAFSLKGRATRKTYRI